MTKAQDLSLQLDTSVYPLDAIQAAAYAFTDRLNVLIDRKGKGPVSVHFKPKAGTKDIEALSIEFQNELLHETLRLKVSQANQKIREYIVTKALVSAQVPSTLPPAALAASVGAQGSCPECEAGAKADDPQAGAPQPVDAELEKEIEKLLAEIEKGGDGEDPLGVAVPWEQKYGAKAEKIEVAEKAPAAKSKPAADGSIKRRTEKARGEAK